MIQAPSFSTHSYKRQSKPKKWAGLIKQQPPKISSPLKKMFPDPSHQSYISEQSSDLHPYQQSSSPSSFLTSQHEISSIALYTNMPNKLLYDPSSASDNKDKESALEDIFARSKKLYAFDSLVQNRELWNRELKVNQACLTLEMEIQVLRNLRDLKREELCKVKAQNIGRNQAKAEAEKIFKGSNFSTPTIKQNLQEQQWLNDREQALANKEAVEQEIEYKQERKLKQLENKIEQYQEAIQNVKDDIIAIKQQIIETQKQTENRRYELKKRLIETTLNKEKMQIRRLEETIRKMEDFIKMNTERMNLD